MLALHAVKRNYFAYAWGNGNTLNPVQHIQMARILSGVSGYTLLGFIVQKEHAIIGTTRGVRTPRCTRHVCAFVYAPTCTQMKS